MLTAEFCWGNIYKVFSIEGEGGWNWKVAKRSFEGEKENRHEENKQEFFTGSKVLVHYIFILMEHYIQIVRQ